MHHTAPIPRPFCTLTRLLIFSLAWAAFALAVTAPARTFAAPAAHAGDWAGSCNGREVNLTISGGADNATGTLSVGDTTFYLKGASDSEGLFMAGACESCVPLERCEIECAASGDAEMSCMITRTGRLGIARSVCEAQLVQPSRTVNFRLLMGHAQQPSNMYLFFSTETYDGRPLTGLAESDFAIYENDGLVSEFESLQTIIPNPTLYTMATVLLLDMSGSILESDTLSPLKASAGSFLEKVAGAEGQEVALYLFDGRAQPKLVLDFTTNARALQNAVEALTKNALTSDPAYDVSTNLNGAVLYGLEILDAKQAAMARGQLFSGSLVVFTDGDDLAGRVSDDAAVKAVQTAAHACFTIGLGVETDEQHLAALGRSGFAWAADSAGLDSAFDKIAEDIRAESGKHYILGYCSPKRKGTHRVTLKVKNYAGSISYTFSADTFTGGCEPLAIMDGFEPGSGTCVLSVLPESIRKIPLIPRYVLLTITAPAAVFNRSSRVEIDGVTVLPPIVSRPSKLIVPAWISGAAQPGPRDVTVVTGPESLTCYDLFRIR